MQEFTVAHILDPHQVGDRFTMWPLHITVIPPFQAPSLEDVVRTLEPIVSKIQPLLMQTGDLARYGVNRVVLKLLPSPELSSLHSKLIQAGEERGWHISGRYTGIRYTPHITRKAGRLYEGSDFQLDTLAIVEAQPQGYRQIVAVLPLKGAAHFA